LFLGPRFPRTARDPITKPPPDRSVKNGLNALLFLRGIVI
jgi:hypothetical protein